MTVSAPGVVKGFLSAAIAPSALAILFPTLGRSSRLLNFLIVVEALGDTICSLLPSHLFVHSFIPAISLALFQVLYYAEALPTQHEYCAVISRRSATGNCE